MFGASRYLRKVNPNLEEGEERTMKCETITRRMLMLAVVALLPAAIAAGQTKEQVEMERE